MAKYQGTPEFSHDQPPSTGVLLVNLGTPDAPDRASVRRYLKEFLWDPRVIEIARPLWWLILHGVILRLRPSKVARAYQSIWTDKGSPLLAISERLSVALQQRLSQQVSHRIEVALAMLIAYGVVRYTNSEHPVWAAFVAVGHYETGSE